MITEDNLTGKQPWLAVFLSALLPGVGQIYGGAKRRGFCFILLWVVLSMSSLLGCIFFLLSNIATEARFFLFMSAGFAILSIILSIYVLFDAYKAARRYNKTHDLIIRDIRKQPWLAICLSYVLPGLGQLYNKQILKGIVFIIAAFGVFAATDLFYPLFIMAILIKLLSMKDAFDSANKISGANTAVLREGSRIARISVILVVIINAFPFAEIIETEYLESYRFPSGSMLPTLQVGDFILADKKFEKHQIKRGDVIVFKYPVDPERDFLKRVIAVGGDTVESKDKMIFINGVEISESYVRHIDSDIRKDERDNFGPLTVPEDSVFVLGDNRDQSYDSRFWGFVPNVNIKGKVFKIYWSWEHDKGEVRWERIGKYIYENLSQ